MSTSNVSQHLDTQYGIKISPGRKGECPFCHKKTFSVRKDDSLGKCFHPGCGRAITSGSLETDYTGSLFEILDRIKTDFHAFLLEQAGKENYHGAYEYIVKDRKIDQRVIRDADIGSVPQNYDIDAAFKDSFDALETRKKDLEAKLKESQARRLAAKAEREKDQKAGQQQSKPSAKDKTEHEKRWEAALVATQDAETFLRDQKDSLKEKILGAADWIVFFHTDALHRVRSLRFRRPFGKDFRSHCPFKDSGGSGKTIQGVFGHGMFSLFQGEVKRALNQLILVEGEFNQLQLQSLAARCSPESGDVGPGHYANWIAATGSATSPDTGTIRKLLQAPGAEPFPIICYDNDDAGVEMAHNLSHFFTVRICTVPTAGKDIDDLIRAFGSRCMDAQAAVARILCDAQLLNRPFGAVANYIFRLRQKLDKDDLRREFEINADVAKCIIKDLRERGTFYFHVRDTYFFVAAEKKLLALDNRDEELTLLLHKYGLNATESTYKYVCKALHVEALTTGTETTIHLLSYYNKDAFTLYIYNHASNVYRITADTIELVDNGTDGVLFLRNPKNEPFELVGQENLGDLFDEHVTSQINFVPDGAINVEGCQTLFDTWFLSMFFNELLPTKALIAFIGPKGSGKSFTLRKVGILLYGSKFDVLNLPDKEDSFDAVVTNVHFAAFDQADSRVAWLQDRLAICATGGTIPKREYYTTNTLVDFPVNCFIGITSRTPHFRRDDVADRLLINHVRRFDEKSFVAEGELLDRVVKHRNRIMTGVVRRLQEVIQALKGTAGQKYQTSFRMADFATFALRIADFQGCKEKVEGIFDLMVEEQAVFTLEADELLEPLRRWASVKENQKREVLAKELFAELKKIAEEGKLEFHYKSPVSLGIKLNNLQQNLCTIMGVQIRTEANKKQKLYSFWLLEDDKAKPTPDNGAGTGAGAGANSSLQPPATSRNTRTTSADTS